jgi:peptidyl-prolyl cis-trans isomerase SurA
MFKKRILTVLMILIAAGLFAQNSFVDKPVAIVKLTRTDVISQKKLAQNITFYESQAGRALSMVEKEQVLQTLINQMLVSQAAERDNVTLTDEQVLQAGMNQMMQQVGQQLNKAQYKQIIENMYREKLKNESQIARSDNQSANQLRKTLGMETQKYEESSFDENEFQARFPEFYNNYLNDIRDQLILEKYVSEKKMDFIRATAMASSDEIELFYRQNEEKFINPEMVKFSHIFFATKGQGAGSRDDQKKAAESVHRKIVKGDEDFVSMVREHSDDKGSIVRDGDIGNFIDRGEQNMAIFGGDFLNSIFDLKLNKLSDVLESSQGFHIVKVNQHNEKRFLGLDDPVSPVETTTVRQYIGNVVSYQKQQQAFQIAAEQVVNELTEDADVQLFTENIK